MDILVQDARDINNMQKFIHKDNEYFANTYKQILRPIINNHNVSIIDNETIIFLKNKTESWITIQFYKEDKSYRIRFECYQKDFLKAEIEAIINNFQGLEVQFNVHNEVIVLLLNRDFFDFHSFEEIEFKELIQLTYLSNLKKSGNLTIKKLNSIRCISEDNFSLYKRFSNTYLNYFWSEPNNQEIEKVFCMSMFQDSYLTLNNIHAKEFFDFKFTNYTSGRKKSVEEDLLIFYEQKHYTSKLIWNKGSHPKLLLNEELVEILSIKYIEIAQILSQAVIGVHTIPYLRFSKQNDTKYLLDIVERDNKLPIYDTKDSSESTIEELKQFTDLDIMGVSFQRREQQWLRKFLFDYKDNGQCSICGREFPISFLIVAHIKPRAKCNDTEKRDFRNIVVPMCRFGCDELFERGNIAIHNGKVVCIPKINSTPALNEYILTVIDKECIHWSNNNHKYFQWHYDYHMNNKEKRIYR